MCDANFWRCEDKLAPVPLQPFAMRPVSVAMTTSMHHRYDATTLIPEPLSDLP